MVLSSIATNTWEKKHQLTMVQAIKKHLESAIVAKTGGSLQALNGVAQLLDLQQCAR